MFWCVGRILPSHAFTMRCTIATQALLDTNTPNHFRGTKSSQELGNKFKFPTALTIAANDVLNTHHAHNVCLPLDGVYADRR